MCAWVVPYLAHTLLTLFPLFPISSNLFCLFIYSLYIRPILLIFYGAGVVPYLANILSVLFQLPITFSYNLFCLPISPSN